MSLCCAADRLSSGGGSRALHFRNTDPFWRKHAVRCATQLGEIAVQLVNAGHQEQAIEVMEKTIWMTRVIDGEEKLP